MIVIRSRHGILSVSTAGLSDIHLGTHRAYFETILGFRRRPDGQGYDWSGTERAGELLRDVCEYLDENGFPYELDEEANRLLRRSQGAEQRLAEAIAAGRDLLENVLGEPSLPEGFNRSLLPHQWLPVHHLLAVPNAANFSVPGAGKTTMVLAAFHDLRSRGEVECLVVIGPGSAFLPWEEEYRLCFGAAARSVVRLSGSPEEREVAYRRALRAELVLVTYHTANNDRAALVNLLRHMRAMLVLDESHYVKGSGALAEAVLHLAPEAVRRVVLTGTPMPNGYLDLWTQATFLWPEQHLFGNRVQFRSLVSSSQGQDTAKERVRPLFTRVRKSDLDLPQQNYVRIPVSMAPHQRRIYDLLAARTLNDLGLLPGERTVIRQWRRARMVRLLQAASNPALLAQHSIEFSLPPEDSLDRPVLEVLEHYLRFEQPKKVLAAVELTRQLLENPHEKVIIWTHFVHNIELLLEYLADVGALPLYGAVPREGADDEDYSREQHVRAFRHDSSRRVLVANPGAAAESVSLHKVCHHAIYLDRTFNAGQFMQSRDRIHRVGLAAGEEVTYHLLLSEGTIDETVDRRLHDKEQRMFDVLDDPNIPTAGMQVSTDHLSGPDEEEEAIDFDAVIQDLQRRLQRHRL